MLFVALVLAFVGCRKGRVEASSSEPTPAVESSQIVIGKIAALEVGQTSQLVATATNAAGESRDVTAEVTWTVAKGQKFVAIGDATETKGQVTALAVGKAKIQATLASVSATVTVQVVALKLKSLKIKPAPVSLPVGQTVQLEAKGTYSDGTTKTLTSELTWSTKSKGTIADVSASVPGLLRSLVVGQDEVTAKSTAGVVTTEKVEVVPAALRKILIFGETLSAVVGVSGKLQAVGVYSDGTTRDITQSCKWTTTKPAVATVSNLKGKRGRVSFVGGGKARVTATLSGISGAQDINVANTALQSLSIVSLRTDLPLGYATNLTAIGKYADGQSLDLTSAVTWASSDSAVLVVGNDAGHSGEASALTLGSAVVTATFGSESDTLNMTTSNAIARDVVTDPATLDLVVDQTGQLGAQGIFSDGTTLDLTELVSWSSSAGAVATVSNDAGFRGLVTAESPGAATVTAMNGSLSDSTATTVRTDTLVSVSLSGSSNVVPIGYSMPIKATGHYSSGVTADITSNCVWSSTDTGVAIVQYDNGKLSALQSGETSIRAACDAIEKQISVSVADATLQSIEVSAPDDNAIIGVGQFLTLTATGHFSDDTELDLTSAVQWISLDPSVAYVINSGTTKGKVGGSSLGTATMRASFKLNSMPSALTDDLVVTVGAASMTGLVVLPTPASAGITESLNFTAHAQYSDGSVADVTNLAAWSSTDPSVASINASTGVASALVAGTTKITASLSGLTSPDVTLTVSGSPAPLDPTGLAATVDSSTAVTLDWTAAGATPDHKIAYQPGAALPSNCDSGTVIGKVAIAGGSTYQITGLAPNQLYAFRVCGVNADDLESFGATTTATTLVAPPSVPTGFTAIAASDVEINLSWTDVAGEAGYVVETSADGTGGWTSVSNPAANATSASHSGLTATTAYYYRIKATNAGGSSGYATANTSTTTAAPGTFAASAVSSSQINLTWADASGETGYVVEWSANGSSGWASVANPAANATGASHSGLNAATTYYYRIRTSSAGGGSPYATASAATLATVATPGSFTATTVSSTQVDLSWADVSTETGYTLQWSANGSTGWTAVSSPAANATTASHTGLTPGTRYYYRLRADRNAETSGFATANAYTAPAAPASFTATGSSSTQINLTWTDVTGETGYTVEWSADGSNGWTTVSTPAANATSASHNGLTAGTVYYYRIKATNTGGSSTFATANASTRAAAPGSFTATAASTSSINLTWTDVAGETGYLVEWSANGSSGWATVATPAADATGTTHSSLSTATTYYYRISATNASGASAYATTNTATLQAAPPNVTGLAASADTATQVTLTWASGGGSTSTYQIAYQTGASAPGDCASGTTTTSASASKVITGLTGGTQYSFRVCAVNANPSPDVSSGSTISKTPAASPPDVTGLTATVNTTTQITLDWASGGGSTVSYKIAYQSGASAPATCNAGTTTTAASATKVITGLSAATQYSFRVCALNDNVTPESSTGATVSGTTNGTVATPAFSVPTGSYGASQSLTLTTTTPGATIYYTTNGATPTTASSVYSSALTINSDQTVKAFAVLAGWTDSAVGSEVYTFTNNQIYNSGSGTFTVPAGVTSLTIEVWGAGGGGGGGDAGSGATGGAGGGGGGYTIFGGLMVTPGQIFSYTVGTGGAGGLGDTFGDCTLNGVAGGASNVASTYYGNGGGGGAGCGASNGTGLGGAGGTASGGTTNTTGTAGTNQTSGNAGTAGGAGANGGAGGAGGANGDVHGAPGTGPGGGGGGAGKRYNGGAGANGRVKFSW